tara:strand:+ start:432 stop:695 length:264 start_codon:yes stop_codon:yes gene_type:complete
MKTITINGVTGERTETDDGLPNERIRHTSEEYLQMLRFERNALLQETDIYALSDVTMSDEMKTYRQALRDLPANTADPSNTTYPTKP